MKNIYSVLISFLIVTNIAWAELDCPADSSVHLDTRTMLPDGSPNPTYGQEISTGLCGCIGFVNGVMMNDNEVTFTLRILDNEPIRGIELDIYHDSPSLVYAGVSKGEKLENVVDEEGNPRTMTLLGNYLEDHLKVLAYSTSRARTAGDGLEGDLVHINYELVEGADLPSEVTFFLGLANLPGTSMDPELLNVVCGYPDEDSPVVVETNALSLDENLTIPTQFALHQNYPNPFNPSTQISFDVPEGSNLVRLNIYNILGKKVSTLLNNVVNPGKHKIEWNAKDNEGNPVASGIYFYELSSSSFTARKKMLLIR
ncbi:MAG: hypothetical protein CMF99_09635 [Candidatus Marinimicrobia bacterium]|nr:hypothetical protein [Candidatus Neomarinimicrobiota bacterium]|tara:strand:- start:1261 stop:2199 length:939 start_codon:yes stop_codon:yes gene_type:complete